MESWTDFAWFFFFFFQIEDLNQQAQMAAAEKFRDKPPAGPGDIPSTVSQPIAEESEEEEVKIHRFNLSYNYHVELNVTPGTQQIC